MLEHKPDHRPVSRAVALHPIFWSKERQLQFLMDVSDRIEKAEKSIQVERLEKNASLVIGRSWNAKFPTCLQEGKRRIFCCILNSVIFRLEKTSVLPP